MNRSWFLLAVVITAVVLSQLPYSAVWAAEDFERPLAKPQDSDGQALQKLLELAWSGDQNAFPAVKEQYESRQKTAGNKSEWHYAYGISLVHLKKFAPAVLAFQASISDSPKFYFPAWKGAIWSELSLKKFEPALSRIETLGTEIHNDKFRGAKEDREQVAIWIGQTLAAVQKLNSTPKIVKQVQQTEETLLALWSEELRDAYESGKGYTDSLYAELMDDLKQATDAGIAKEEDAKKEKAARFKEGASSADQQREALKKKAEEAQKVTEQRLAQIDKQLQRLERDYNYLEARAMNLMGSLSLIQNEMNFVPQQNRDPANTNNRNNRNNQNITLNDGQANTLFRLSLQSSVYQMELQATSIRASMVVQQAMSILESRSQLIGQANVAATELAGRDTQLSQWKARMVQAEENVKKQVSKGHSLSTKAKRAKAKTLSTYLEFDPDWERIQLTERSQSPEQK